MTDSELFQAVRSGWPQLMGIFAIIWWSRKIDLKVKDHASRLDRHENRLTHFEATQQQQALQLARIEESLSGIKLTLDRIYTQMSERSRIQHHNERTIPPR
ncbi:hypothetical protein [Paracoccus siganidrum]|nr:hypothetical protein [Paracoccus siganidrum]